MTELLGSIKDLSEYLKDLSEATLGLLGLFGGFLKRVAPPERSAWIWSGLASVVAAVSPLRWVKVLGLRRPLDCELRCDLSLVSFFQRRCEFTYEAAVSLEFETQAASQR
jgi:hypothetical protein